MQRKESFQKLALTQQVTRMKKEVEKQIGEASVQQASARSKVLEQKQEIFSKEIKGIIEKLEAGSALAREEGHNSSKKKKKKKEGHTTTEISFHDVSLRCPELTRGWCPPPGI